MPFCELIVHNYVYICGMKKQYFPFVVFFLALFVGKTNAEESWRHLEGLPCEETSCIAQDADGFLWFGTRLGLVRYDGYVLKTFRNDMQHPHFFSSSDIKSLTTDNDGNIYAGAFFGLNTLNLHTQTNLISYIAQNNYVHALLSDTQGRLWMGTDEGLYLRSGKSEEPRLYKDVPRDYIVQLKQSDNGDVYVVTEHRGVFVISAHHGCQALEGTKELKPRAVEVDKGGDLWLGTDRKGLFRIHRGAILHHPGFDDCYVNDLLVRHGYNASSVLIATEKGCYNEKGVMLCDKNIQDLFEDRNGNVWASTVGQGIWVMVCHRQQFFVQSRDFTHHTTPIMSQFDVRHLSDTTLWKSISYINCLYEDRNGTTYIGTWNDGFYVTQNGHVCQHVNRSNAAWLKRNDIYAFATLESGNVLFSTWDGLYLFTPENGSGCMLDRIGTTDIHGLRVLSITPIGRKELWLGLVGGIAHIRFNDQNPAQSSVTLYTHVNAKGINKPQKVVTQTDTHTQMSNYQIGGVYRLVSDVKGRIWACTSEPGLLCYDKGTDSFRSVSGELGILGDNVHSLDIDAQGDFWLTTNYGILRMRLADSGAVIYRQLYTRQNGLPTNYYGSTMSTRLYDETIAFLNPYNLVSVIPSKTDVDKIQRACIADVQVNGIALADMNAETDGVAPYVSRMTLFHDQNNMAISFSTRSYGDESSIRYAYHLDGVDREVQYTGMGENTIHYSQLHPGTYVLHYGVADDILQEQTLTIEILQPLWWRWWARLLYVVVIIAIIAYVVHTIIVRNLRNYQFQLLAAEKQALDEQYRSKMLFYTRVIHEFLTPVTLMSEMIRELQEKVRPSLQATLFMLSRQNDKLLEAINNTLDIREEDNSIQVALQKAQEMTQTDRDFLRRCTESVNNHIADEDYSHQVMMREVGASHATLYRKLKALTGMDATSFIRSIRMKAACQILSEQPDILVNELAERVGYSNPKYFSRCFKAEFGITPKDYNHISAFD